MRKFLSFVLSSKNFQRLKPFLDQLQETCYDPESFEVCVVADDETVNQVKDAAASYKFEIRSRVSNHGYQDNIKHLNRMIFEISNQSTYFVSLVSDRYRFSSRDWDLTLRDYIGVVPDDMFFLRLAKYSKNVKYKKSLIHAFNCNETWGIFSRKLITTVGFFPEEYGHDAGFEMLYFFIQRNKKDPFRRDVVLPNKLSTDAQVLSTAEGDVEFYRRSLETFLRMKKTFNRKFFENLKMRADKVYLAHTIWKSKIDGVIEVDEEKKLSFIRTKSGKKIREISHKISFFFVLRQKFSLRYKAIRFEDFIIAFRPLISNKDGYDFTVKMMKSDSFFYKSLLSFLRLVLGCGSTNFVNQMSKEEVRNFLIKK